MVSNPITCCSVMRWVSTPRGMECPQHKKTEGAFRPLERRFRRLAPDDAVADASTPADRQTNSACHRPVTSQKKSCSGTTCASVSCAMNTISTFWYLSCKQRTIQKKTLFSDILFARGHGATRIHEHVHSRMRLVLLVGVPDLIAQVSVVEVAHGRDAPHSIALNILRAAYDVYRGWPWRRFAAHP